MKRIRIFSIVFCFVSAVVFFLYLYNTRKILDNQGPVITMDRDTIELSVNDPQSRILEGVTAWDSRDGDTTELLLVEQFANFLENGRRHATIAAFDAAGNVTKAVREVVYTDYTSPRFHLTQALSFPENTSSVTRYITAEDCLDGDITAAIRLSSEDGITMTKEGLYEAVFMVSNSAGDTARLPVTVEIYNNQDHSRQPGIVLTDYLVYIEKGESFDPQKYVEEIYMGSRSYMRDSRGVLRYSSTAATNMPAVLSFEDIDVENPVDTDTEGVYEVVYRYSWDGSVPGSTRLIVVVTDEETRG